MSHILNEINIMNEFILITENQYFHHLFIIKFQLILCILNWSNMNSGKK